MRIWKCGCCRHRVPVLTSFLCHLSSTLAIDSTPHRASRVFESHGSSELRLHCFTSHGKFHPILRIYGLYACGVCAREGPQSKHLLLRPRHRVSYKEKWGDASIHRQGIWCRRLGCGVPEPTIIYGADAKELVEDGHDNICP